MADLVWRRSGGGVCVGVGGRRARGAEPRPYTFSGTLYQSREPVWPSGKALGW